MNEQLEKLRAFLTEMTAPMADQFEEQQSVLPMWIVEGDDGHLTIFATPWEDDHEKKAAVTYMKAKMKALKTKRYVHIGEVWMLTAPSGDRDRDDIVKIVRGETRVSQHPERVEAVIALAEDKYGNGLQLIRHILRPTEGKATLGPADIHDFSDAKTEGLLTHMLED